MVPNNNKNNTSNVLVVDDQAITRELLVRAISAQGFSVDSSASGEEALNLWQHKKTPNGNH
ncbi:MAG: response regulator [Methylophilaceae bacterium]